MPAHFRVRLEKVLPYFRNVVIEKMGNLYRSCKDQDPDRLNGGRGPSRKTCDSFYELCEIKTEQVYRSGKEAKVLWRRKTIRDQAYAYERT